MLAAALLIDAALGDPPWLWRRLPHPVVLIGRLIDLLDRRLNRGADRRWRGVLALGLLVLAVLLPALALALLPYGWIAETLGAAILLAHRSLIEHVRGCAEGLRVGLAEGRAAVARIVGRDPKRLDEAAVARAAIESAAENFSDGVVAPAFWFLVAGLPGIAVYKAVNTADSMIGHRTERHGAFGWATAKLDTALNFIPARLTAAFFLLAGGVPKAWRTVVRDAPGHRSVNAGWPEAAMGAFLGVALAGPRAYGGQSVADPWMHADGRREATPEDIERAVALLWRVWAGILNAALILAFIWIF